MENRLNLVRSSLQKHCSNKRFKGGEKQMLGQINRKSRKGSGQSRGAAHNQLIIEHSR